MTDLKLSTLTLKELRTYVQLKEQFVDWDTWLSEDYPILSDLETQGVEAIVRRIKSDPLHLLNEATLWSRAIYPLLLLAERENLRAWAEVNLSAQYPQFQLEGVADGVLGMGIGGRIETPYLVMVEAKRGVDNQNPLFQLYGQLLAAAWLNAQAETVVQPCESQQIFGCYTIADSWTFVWATVTGFTADRPTLTATLSREYSEKLEAFTILKILKAIIAQQLGERSFAISL